MFKPDALETLQNSMDGKGVATKFDALAMEAMGDFRRRSGDRAKDENELERQVAAFLYMESMEDAAFSDERPAAIRRKIRTIRSASPVAGTTIRERGESLDQALYYSWRKLVLPLEATWAVEDALNAIRTMHGQNRRVRKKRRSSTLDWRSELSLAVEFNFAMEDLAELIEKRDARAIRFARQLGAEAVCCLRTGKRGQSQRTANRLFVKGGAKLGHRAA